jgi:ribosomal protein L10
MKKEEKEGMVLELREKFSRAKVAVLAEFSGMGVEEVREVKNLLRGVKGEFKVVKNTMAIRAAVGTTLEGISRHFKGPTAVALGYEDPIAPAKALKTIADKQKKLKIKAGVIENQVIDLAGLKQIAQLPSRPVLLGQLIGRFKSPLYGLAGSLNGVLSKFARTLHALHEKRQTPQS